MAWWPFGKKKPEDAAAEGDAAPPATPPSAEIPPAAPTMLVPPEFQVTDNAPAPGAPEADPFAAPAGHDPFTQTLEDPASPKRGRAPSPPTKVAPTAPAAANDPFAGAPRNDFAQTMEDPDGEPAAPAPAPRPRAAAAPKALDLGADPFAAPPAEPAAGDPFAAPGDPFAPPPSADALDPFAQPADPGAMPSTDPFAQPAAPPPAPKRTMEMPARVPREARESTPRQPPAPPPAPVQQSPAPPPAPPPAPTPSTAPPNVENAMQAAKTAISPEKRRLGLALLAGGPITHERLQAELDRSGKGTSVIGGALLRSNFPTEEELLSIIVARIRVPKINVKNTKIPLETIRNIPADVARSTRTIAVEKIGDILVVVSPDTNEQSLQAVRRATGSLVFPFQCDAEGFDEILSGYYDRLASSGLGAPASPLAGDAPPPATPPVAVQPAPPSGAMAALAADDGEDQWTRLFAAAGPIPAEEVLL